MSDDFGDEGARPSPDGLMPPRLAIERLARSDLGAIGQCYGHQLVEHSAGVDQRDLEVVVFERLDHSSGVEPEHLSESGALNAPLLTRRDCLLFKIS